MNFSVRHFEKLEFIVLLVALTFLFSCGSKPAATEQINLRNASPEDSVLSNAIDGTLAADQILTTPHRVVLTGIPNHRLITIYKQGFEKRVSDYDSYYQYDPWYSDRQQHYMPGIDLISGYNLLNIAHYDFAAQKVNMLFDKHVLIKSLYYPSFVQDSLHKKPINRNYYLISVYDEDTNRDSLIDNRDLRRFYYYPDSGVQQQQVIPSGYSVLRSQYDSGNDVMYIYARQDQNKDGRATDKEPVHIFWIDLTQPAVAKRMY